MNRRQFVQSIVVAGAVSALPALSSLQPTVTKVGKVTAKTHRRKARVYLDGVDVTNDSFEADDIAGYVDCYIRDEVTGNFFRRKGEDGAASLRRYGDVRIELIEAKS